ncbi:kinase-like domain-containing protein [Blakeslea trispora]|nr:kinase-like domain-containing protein [Blakeslea trispora]
MNTNHILLRKSCSEQQQQHKRPKSHMTKRRSLGNSQCSNHHTNNQRSVKTPHWRSPGYCEIPNILKSTYLLPFTIPSTKYVNHYLFSKPPWISVGSNWTPLPLPPIIRNDENGFEKRIRQSIPKIQVVSKPHERYVGSKKIGTGVNGAVIQVQLEHNVNVKLALKRCILSYDRDYRTAIVRELRIMSTAHPNLIKLREVSIYQNEVWIAMDLMRCSVFTVLCKRGLPEEHAVYIARQTLNALSFLHSKGFIHRDIKCENLLIGYHGEIKLADFGLTTSTRYMNCERLGTPKWMAPEVIKGINYTEKVDLWSLGITVIEMMDRVPPHYDVKQDERLFSKILASPSPTFSYSHPTVYCTGLVAWLLEDHPDHRPSAKDVIQELDLHLEQGLLKATSSQELLSFFKETL